MDEENQAKKLEEEKVTEKQVSNDVNEEKDVIPTSSPVVAHQKDLDEIKEWETSRCGQRKKLSESDWDEAIIPSPTPPASEKKLSGSSLDRDVELAKLEQEKKISLIKAWEESEKTKAQNKACKKLSAIDSWENTKKAYVEAELRKMEEKLEKKKAEYAEKMKNKVAELHKQAEEKKAMVEAQKGEELLKAEECAAKYRATGNTPKKFLGCFGC